MNKTLDTGHWTIGSRLRAQGAGQKYMDSKIPAD
jgi:hypothetical protein